MKFSIEPLGPNHDRAAFSCGSPPLDEYLKTQARKAVEKNLAVVFVLTPDGKKIAGYYTLSAYSVKLDEIPPEIAKKLTRMPEVPTTLIGRLARSEEFHGAGLGEILLIDALKRSYDNTKQVASWAVIVDAKDERAIQFYKKFAFIEFPSKPNRLFLPIQTIAEMYSSPSLSSSSTSASSTSASSTSSPAASPSS